MGMQQCKPVVTPFAMVNPELREKPVSQTQADLTRAVVGKLLWVVPERPDLAYATKELSRQVAHPTMETWEGLKRITRYLAGTLDARLWLSIDPSLDPMTVLAIADANWATSSDGRSTTGATIWVQGFLIMHFSRTQTTIALSSCEAELLALNTSAAEAKMIQSMLEGIMQMPATLI